MSELFGPPFCISILKVLLTQILRLFIAFQCILHDSGVIFSQSWNIYKSKTGVLISGGNQFCRMSELFGPAFCISILKVFLIQIFVVNCILMYSAWFRSASLSVFKFVQIKEEGLNFWEEPILQNVWIIWSPFLYFNLKSSIDPNSLWFITFQSILHEPGRLFSESWNFCKLKRGDLISGGNQFCRMSELFGPPFCISILKVF